MIAIGILLMRSANLGAPRRRGKPQNDRAKNSLTPRSGTGFLLRNPERAERKPHATGSFACSAFALRRRPAPGLRAAAPTYTIEQVVAPGAGAKSRRSRSRAKKSRPRAAGSVEARAGYLPSVVSERALPAARTRGGSRDCARMITARRCARWKIFTPAARRAAPIAIARLQPRESRRTSCRS